MALADGAMTVIITVPINAGEKTKTLTKFADESWATFRERVDSAIQRLQEYACE